MQTREPPSPTAFRVKQKYGGDCLGRWVLSGKLQIGLHPGQADGWLDGVGSAMPMTETEVEVLLEKDGKKKAKTLKDVLKEIALARVLLSKRCELGLGNFRNY